jgi:hypothetical protein
LPSLSTATSTMDSNSFAAAPHEPDEGVRRPGSHALDLGPLVCGAKMPPIKKIKMGGAPVLDVCCSMG